MNENRENEEKISADDRKKIPFDRAGGPKRPYESPKLVKLGSVEKLTNVSILMY